MAKKKKRPSGLGTGTRLLPFPTTDAASLEIDKLQESVDFARYAARILTATNEATSEADLQGQLDGILRDLLAGFDVVYKPVINNTLMAAGLSETSSERPDSLFGHVVLDYKIPKLLSDARQLEGAKKQVEEYLNQIAGGGPTESPRDAARWAGILWDGHTIVFCQSDGTAWKWSKAHPTSRASLQNLVHFYRSLHRKPLTSQFLTRSFGRDSKVARELIPSLCRALAHPKHRTSMLFREWRRMFQQLSTYELRQLTTLMQWATDMGVKTDDTSELLFATHTYYSIVVKLLSSELLAAAHGFMSTSLADAITNAPTDSALLQQVALIEDSELYRRYRITNFLEGDFFSWYIGENGKDIADGLRHLARELLDFEPGTVILRPESIHDLLKQFYGSLVDEQIRHDLGEYYTPDWLAKHLLDSVGYTGLPEKALLDPTCGSGTFLIEAIVRLRAQCEAQGMNRLQTLRTIVRNIRGLDLNPLAVISARANYILALADLILSLGDDIELPVYLADSINVPMPEVGFSDLEILRYPLETELGTFDLRIPTSLVKHGVLGQVLFICEECIETGAGRGVLTPPRSTIRHCRVA